MDPDPDPGGSKTCGSADPDPVPDPDPQHCSKPCPPFRCYDSRFPFFGVCSATLASDFPVFNLIMSAVVIFFSLCFSSGSWPQFSDFSLHFPFLNASAMLQPPFRYIGLLFSLLSWPSFRRLGLTFGSLFLFFILASVFSFLVSV